MKEKFQEILQAVYKNNKTNDFSGLGILLTQVGCSLPIFPLRENSDLPHLGLIDTLSLISDIKHPLHDGFHIIDNDWNIVKLAQYFSPPIISTVKVNYDKAFGGRYLAALFGSMIPGVMLAGVASNSFGVAIFENGKEIFYERHM